MTTSGAAARAALSLALAGAFPVAAAAQLPPWLKSALALSVPAYDKDTHGVVVYDAGITTVGLDGRVTRTTRHAVRVLDRDGAALAIARIEYDTDVSKVRELRAWLIHPNGTAKHYGGKEMLDIALVENDVYNEARARVISGSDNVVPGAVFAYESTVEAKTFFAGDSWSFQSRLPALRSSYTLVLPEGWRAEGTVFNHAGVVPAVSGSSFTWELSGLPPIKEEPAAPGLGSLAPYLLVRYSPPDGGAAGASVSFTDWTSVSRWATALVEPQVVPSEALVAKARALVQGAQGEWAQIAAVARFVQSINYISVQIGMGRFRPHAASEVLTKSYGDCKDKASLMLALLRVLDMHAHVVLVAALDPDAVRQECPSPAQFDHAILAIELKSPRAGAATIDHPRLGKLLFFDPTDRHTPLGDLPGTEQGGWGLLAGGEAGGLVRLPLLPPSARRVERRLDVTVDQMGGVTARVEETSWGQSGVDERRTLRGQPGDFRHRVERWLAKDIRAAQVDSIEPSDSEGEGRFDLKVVFGSPSHGQVMQGRLLVFCPVLLSRRDFAPLTDPERQHPIRIESGEFSETSRIALPAGFAVDDLPPPVTLEAPFARYSFALEAHPDHLVVTRRLTTQRALIPASEYKSVRQLFEKMAVAEQARVVLVRQ